MALAKDIKETRYQRPNGVYVGTDKYGNVYSGHIIKTEQGSYRREWRVNRTTGKLEQITTEI